MRHRWLFIGALLLAGCNSKPDRPDRDPPPPPPPPPRSSAPSSSASAAQPALPELAPSSSASAGPADLAGAWEGHYEAKKGAVALPPNVKDKGFAADDGKTAIGAGNIVITIASRGDIHGKISGALGAGSISGKVDGKMIRAGVNPEDPLAANAMTGILVGAVNDDTIACELHVAGPDGTMIRESKVELKRKKP